MRFVAYNIHRGVDSSGSRSIRTVAAVLSDLEPDVVGLNEVLRVPLLSDQAARMGRWLGMEQVFRRTTFRRGVPFGNAVLVRGHLADPRGVRLPGGREPRGLLLVDAQVNGWSFAFGATHLDLHPTVRDTQLAALAEALPRNYPAVLAGDFNAPRERLGPLLERFESSSPQLTFPVPDPVAAIDHILFTRHWRLRDSFAVARPASDHAALVVDLEPRGFGSE